jgi:hypothetical protein
MIIISSTLLLSIQSKLHSSHDAGKLYANELLRTKKLPCDPVEYDIYKTGLVSDKFIVNFSPHD